MSTHSLREGQMFTPLSSRKSKCLTPGIREGHMSGRANVQGGMSVPQKGLQIVTERLGTRTAWHSDGSALARLGTRTTRHSDGSALGRLGTRTSRHSDGSVTWTIGSTHTLHPVKAVHNYDNHVSLAYFVNARICFEQARYLNSWGQITEYMVSFSRSIIFVFTIYQHRQFPTQTPSRDVSSQFFKLVNYSSNLLHI